MKKSNFFFVTNNTPTITKNNFTSLSIKFQTNKAQTRYETLEGKQYLVVPCVMMTEGVHEGSGGAIYYSVEELAKVPVAWNSKPVVVYHPEFNGQSVSACDPIILEKYRIGTLYNTKWEDGKLKTECWIDEEKANQVDERVLEAIENGTMMEVSTGLFMDNEKEEGEWNGEKYYSIASNFRPDHLAILPDLKGACSIEDGAGLLRNVELLQGAEKRLADNLFEVFNELSHNEIWRELNNKIESSAGKEAWVMDVFDDFFIYEIGEKLFFQKYEINADDEVKLIGIREEVEKIIQYQKTDGTLVGNIDNVNQLSVLNVHNNQKEIKMDKKKFADALIANEKTAWTEDDRKYLMELDEEKLTLHIEASETKTEPTANEDPKKESKIEPKTPEVKGKDDGEGKDNTPTDNQEMTVDQYIKNAPEGLRDVLQLGLDTHQAKKTELIQKITTNSKNPYTPEQLNAKDVGELEKIATLAEVSQAPAQPIVPALNFGGQAPLAPVENEENEEPLIAPSIVNEVLVE